MDNCIDFVLYNRFCKLKKKMKKIKLFWFVVVSLNCIYDDS